MTTHIPPERISEYLDGRLSPVDTAEVDRHIGSCPECRREVESIRVTRDLIRSVGAPPPKAGFEERIHAGVMANVAARHGTPWRRWAVAATVLLTGWAAYRIIDADRVRRLESPRDIAENQIPAPSPAPEPRYEIAAKPAAPAPAERHKPEPAVDRPTTIREKPRTPREVEALAPRVEPPSPERVLAYTDVAPPDQAEQKLSREEPAQEQPVPATAPALPPEEPVIPPPTPPAEETLTAAPLVVAQEKSVKLARAPTPPLADAAETQAALALASRADADMDLEQMPTPALPQAATAPLPLAEPETPKSEDKTVAMMMPAAPARYATPTPSPAEPATAGKREWDGFMAEGTPAHQVPERKPARKAKAAPAAISPAPVAKASPAKRAEASAAPTAAFDMPALSKTSQSKRSRIAPTEYVFHDPAEAWSRLSAAAARVGAWVDSRTSTRWTIKYPDTSNAYAVLDAVLTASSSDSGTAVRVRWIEIPNALDINDASVEELMRLPGIDEYRAKMIDAYRYTYGRFQSVEDLKGVPDITDEIYEGLKDRIRVK